MQLLIPDELVRSLQDPTFRLWYLLGGWLLMVVPMLITAIWYHRNIVRSPGGRALMKRQNASYVNPRASPSSAARQLNDGISILRAVSSGQYGQHARRLQNRVYWVTGFWILAQVIYFGLIIWADEIARVPTSALP